MNTKNAILIGLAVLAGMFFLYTLSVPHGTPTEYGGASASSSAGQAQNSGVASAYAQKTGSVGSIEIEVQPLDLGSSTWTFNFGLNTHSGSLDMDMRKVVMLTDGRGDAFTPTAWDGPAAGGHHRNGTLTFAAPSTIPKNFTITVTLPDNPPQTFLWSTQ